MSLVSARSALADTVTSFALPEEEILQRLHRIQQDVLAQSRFVLDADFTSIHPDDLKFLFGAYDTLFFSGLCNQALGGRKLTFRLSGRMTRAGGTTTRFRTPSGEPSFEIAIAVRILFHGFGKLDRRTSVCGRECESRLEAMQRIFEHEMVHLTEYLCWNDSNCSAARFQDIARRLFLHRAHTHNLITQRERAAVSGILVGSKVGFTFEGRLLIGRVNRITTRATVLVEHAEGSKYSDGLRYRKYYVPLAHLKPDFTEGAAS